MNSNSSFVAAWIIVGFVISFGCRTSPQSRVAPNYDRSHFASIPSTEEQANSTVQVVTLERPTELNELMTRSSNRVVIDFYADWCGPCRQQSEILDAFANRMETPIQGTIVKVNIDQHPELAKLFDVDALPTIVLLDDGQVVSRKTGIVAEDQLLAFLGK